MSKSWDSVKTVCCKPWLVLPTVYSDALSYGEQLDKFCYSLNKVIENNNILPEYVAEKIKEYISSGAIGEVVREILANYILNVKYPPKGIAPAVGDGSADDTEALQGCIDYAAENGGVVYFPYGSYLTQPLTMKNGVSLFGFDRYSTKIVLKGGATKALLNGNGNNLSVCNLTLDGNSGIQVNDVNVVDMTGSNLMFNDLVIKDGYKLFNFVGDGHLQLSNIVFGNAVENCFTVDGNVIVQTNNLLFTALSKVGGVSVVDIRANSGNYDFNSVAKCDTCMLISGNDNKVVAMIGGAAEDYADTGEHNNVEIVGHSQKEYYSGNVKKDANNSETTLQGTRSLHIVGNSTVEVEADSTESVDGNKSEIVTGLTTENYKNNKVTNLTNETKTLSGKKVTNANSVTENITGDKAVNANSVTETITGDKTVNANNVTETITGDKDVNANNVTETITKKKTINAEDLALNTTNPLEYKKPLYLNDFYNYVPFKDYEGNVYKLLVDTGKVPSDIVSVKAYGAKGDGVTSDSTAIQKAVNENIGRTIYFPAGVYLISSTIVLPDNTYLVGDGMSSTELKMANGLNSRVIKNDKYDENAGKDTHTVGNVNITIANLAVNGNYHENFRDNNSAINNTWGVGLSLYGGGLRLDHVYVYNCSTNGILTEWNSYTSGGNISVNGESLFNYVVCKWNGEEGWLYKGPHDSLMINTIIATNGRKYTDTYANLRVGEKGNLRIVNCHFYSDYGVPKVAHSLYLDKDAYQCNISNCHIEGGASQSLAIYNEFNQINNCFIYASFGDADVLIGNNHQYFSNCMFGGPAKGEGTASKTWVGAFKFLDKKGRNISVSNGILNNTPLFVNPPTATSISTWDIRGFNNTNIINNKCANFVIPGVNDTDIITVQGDFGEQSEFYYKSNSFDHTLSGMPLIYGFETVHLERGKTVDMYNLVGVVWGEPGTVRLPSAKKSQIGIYILQINGEITLTCRDGGKINNLSSVKITGSTNLILVGENGNWATTGVN